MDAGAVRAEVDQFRTSIKTLKDEIGKTIVGNEAVVDGVLMCLLAGGHALLEGVPGLGKTMLVRTLSEALSLQFSRIQFTPDLMPADILGTTVIDDTQAGSKVFEFRKGPVFANIVLADEINRATPKTQSALLEAMQEHRVSVGKKTHILDEPFVVLATQNPLEMEGTYPLPEAQLDRFFMKLHVPFPNREELHAILDLTTGEARPARSAVLHRQDILTMQQLVRRVPVARHVQDYAIRVVQATHPEGPDAPDMCRPIRRLAPRRPVGAARGEDPVALRGPLRREHRRRADGGGAVPPAPHAPQLRGRGRGHEDRPGARGDPEGRARDQDRRRQASRGPSSWAFLIAF
jgi:MoxR-like ATPase